MPHNGPSGNWAWDVSLVVTQMPPNARAAFRHELNRWLRLAEDDDRQAHLQALQDSIAQRTAMQDQVNTMFSKASYEDWEGPLARRDVPRGGQ